MGYLFRGEAMPVEVAARLKRQLANPLRQAIRKANKQIAATKRLLRIENGYGLVVFANDKNFGLRPADALTILSDAVLKLSEPHVDGFVYTTPNVYHDNGTDVAQALWVPLYAEGREVLADFVNPFGAAWIDYAETLGDPYIERSASDEYDPGLLLASPIKQFKRG